MLSYEIRDCGEGDDEVADEAAVDDEHGLRRRNRTGFQRLEPNECGHLAENRSVLQVKTVPQRSRKLFFRHGLRLSMKKLTQRNCTASTNTARLNLSAVRLRHRLFRCSIDCCLVQDVCQRSSALYEKPPVSFSGQ